jgi:hypothetical protein
MERRRHARQEMKSVLRNSERKGPPSAGLLFFSHVRRRNLDRLIAM